MMENLPSPISNSIIKSLFRAFVPESFSEEDKFELIIKLKCKNLSVRQFASYMKFIDNAYGRLTPKGLVSYSRSPENELKIEEIKHGSLEIIISKILSEIDSINALILVGLLLKYLPGFIKSTMSTYRYYEEGKLAHARRKKIKEQIKRDKRLVELSDRHIYQLTKFLDAMYNMDIRNLPKAHKFSNETVIEVKFTIKSNSGRTDSGQSGMTNVRLKQNMKF